MTLTKVTYSMLDGPIVNVLDYGADATGATDSYNAFLAAYNSGAGIIVIPLGDFKLGQTLKLDRAVTILGAAAGGTRDLLPSNTSLINFTGTGAAFEIVGSDVNGTRNIHIKNLGIIGTSAGACGILVGNTPTPRGYATMCSIIDVQIRGFVATNACGLHVQYSLNSYFRNVSTYYNYDGIKCEGNNTTLTFESCWSTGNNRYGYYIHTSLVSGNFINCIAESNYDSGLCMLGNVSGSNFYGWHSESNCLTTGNAPTVIYNAGAEDPAYISFFGGYFGDTVPAGGNGRIFDITSCSRICIYTAALPNVSVGFMRVTSGTYYSLVESGQPLNPNDITGNTDHGFRANGVYINSYPKKGNTGSIASGTPTTIKTMSIPGLYTVLAFVSPAGTEIANYANLTQILWSDGGDGGYIAVAGTSDHMIVSLSGDDIQVKQLSGNPKTVYYSIDFQPLH